MTVDSEQLHEAERLELELELRLPVVEIADRRMTHSLHGLGYDTDELLLLLHQNHHMN